MSPELEKVVGSVCVLLFVFWCVRVCSKNQELQFFNAVQCITIVLKFCHDTHSQHVCICIFQALCRVYVQWFMHFYLFFFMLCVSSVGFIGSQRLVLSRLLQIWLVALQMLTRHIFLPSLWLLSFSLKRKKSNKIAHLFVYCTLTIIHSHYS